MYKISICGKANSGKNTVAKLIKKTIREKLNKPISYEYIAFADPIKKMVRTMFPNLPEKYLTGSSKFRSEIIPGAFKDGKPLTVRQLLLDLGTEVGRQYKPDIWLDAFDYTLQKYYYKNLIIVTDVRFRNEFDHLKKLGFYQIRLVRDSANKIEHISETGQDSISDNEFDIIIKNNGTLDDLKQNVKQTVSHII